MERGSGRCLTCGSGRGEIREQPAAVFDALAKARRGSLPALRRERNRSDRMVTARSGSIDGQVSARSTAAGRLAGRESGDEHFLGR